MSKTITSIITLLLLIILFGVGFLVLDKLTTQEEPPTGGVNITHEYQATTTAEMAGGLGAGTCMGDVDHLIAYNQYSGTTLGSVTVVSTTPHALKIKNATTTAATGIFAGSSSTVATLPASLPQGTYVFDTYLDKGLAIDFDDGFCGGYVFTWR